MKNKTKLLRMAMLCMGMVFYATEMRAADYYMTVKCNPTGAAKVYAKHGGEGYKEGTVGTYYAQSTYTFKIKYENPSNGYTFLGWSKGDVATSDDNIEPNLKDVKPGDESSVTLSNGSPTATYYANFTCVQAVSADTIQGSVSCPYTVKLDTTVTLTASPKEGYAFVGWKHGTDADFCSTEASYTFTTNSNNAGTYTAYFAEGASIVAHQTITNGAYWATFYAEDGNYQVPTGTEVYTVTLSGTTMTMNKIADGIVKSGEGVVLKATKGNLAMTKTETEPTGNFTTNSLKGTLTGFTGNENGTIYVLNGNEKGAGFYKLDENGRLAKNKAYLVYSGADAREFFLFDETTSISEELRVKSEEIATAPVYDLQGRRVKNAAKGVYIVNGKKTVIR